MSFNGWINMNNKRINENVLINLTYKYSETRNICKKRKDESI